MENLPGCLLSLLIGILCFAILFGLICLGAWLFQVLPDFALAIIGGVILIGVNVVAFWESYIWKRRKRWYFPMCLTITLCAIIIALIAIFG